MSTDAERSTGREGAQEILYDTVSSRSYLLSVIVPCFNVERFVRRALDSLYDQIDQSVRIIIIDDGSGDDTGGVVRQYLLARHPTNSLFIKQSNMGLSAARNTGLSWAGRSEYISFLDSDDYWLPGVWTRLRGLLNSGKFDLLEFDAVRVSIDVRPNDAVRYGLRLGLSSDRCKNFHSNDYRNLRRIFQKNYWLAWARVYRWRLISSARFDVGRKFEDMMFTPYRYLDAEALYSDPMPLVGYSINNASISQNVTRDGLYDVLYSCERMIYNVRALQKRGEYKHAELLIYSLVHELFKNLLRERASEATISTTAKCSDMRKAAQNLIRWQYFIDTPFVNILAAVALWWPRPVSLTYFYARKMVRSFRFCRVSVVRSLKRMKIG